MTQVEGWVRALAAVLLLAGVAELLLPSGGLKGYARAFMGLLVLLAVLQPLVALVRGEIRLDLPAVSALGAAVPGATLAGQAEAASSQAYEGLVASQAARIAGQVPGVEAASATVDFAPASGGAPGVVSATVSITPTAAGLAVGGGLVGQVRAAVAAGLDIQGSAVRVTVG